MIVYAVEEITESRCGRCEGTEIVGIYKSKEKALAKQEEKEQKYKYNDYIITAYDTETGEIAND